MYDRSILETLDYHRSMLVDKVRMESHLRAILKVVKPGDVVLDIGSGTGILAYFACMAGAKKVYAVEQDPLIGLAEAICRKNGFQDRVVFLNEWSDQVELPEPVDVLLTETLGNIGFEEGILGWIIDAKERLLAKNGRILPQNVELVVVPTEMPEAFDLLDDWDKEMYTLDFSPVAEVVANNLVWNSLSPKAFLSEPAIIAQVETAVVKNADIAGEIVFVANRDGVVDGLGCWFNAQLAPDVTISNGPPFNTPSWTQLVLPLERPLAVSAGDHLHISIQATHNGANWHWQVSKDHPQNNRNGQSTLAGQLLKPDPSKDSRNKPVRAVDGEVDLTILQMMDGSYTIEEISQHLFDIFPLQFRNLDETRSHVILVSEFYGRRIDSQSQIGLNGSNGKELLMNKKMYQMEVQL